jgi:hypothetical protein
MNEQLFLSMSSHMFLKCKHGNQTFSYLGFFLVVPSIVVTQIYCIKTMPPKKLTKVGMDMMKAFTNLSISMVMVGVGVEATLKA